MSRKVIILAVVLLLEGWVRGRGGSVVETSTADDISKMKIKEIKSTLQMRGLECRHCLTKEEYVNLLTENWDRPIVKTADDRENNYAVEDKNRDTMKNEGWTKKTKNDNEIYEDSREKMQRKGIKEPSPDQMQEAMAEMDRQGFGKPTSVSPDDLHGLNEEEIRDQILGRSNKGAKSANSSKKKKSYKRQNTRKSKVNGSKKQKKTRSKRKTEQAPSKKDHRSKNTKRTNKKSGSSRSKKPVRTDKTNAKMKTKKRVEREKLRRSMADQFIEEDLWGQYYGHEEGSESCEDEDSDIIEL